MKIIAAYDNKQSAVETYNANHEPVAQIADLREWRSLDIPSSDGIIAGPPCQDASKGNRYNRQRGLNDLYVETARIIVYQNPSWALVENVEGMVTTPEFRKANQLLMNAGYWVTLVAMNHADYGGLTTRKRVFLAAARKMLSFPTPNRSKYEWLAHGKALEPLLRERQPDGWGGWDLNKARICEYDGDATFANQWGKHRTYRRWTEPYFTVTVDTDKSRWQGAVYAHTLTERGVLQGFPVDYHWNTLADVGNAVPPEFSRAWGKVIHSAYGNNQQIVSLFCGAGGFDFIAGR